MDPAIAGIIAATISALGFIVVGAMSFKSQRKIDAVHVLVDGRLTQALDGIEALQDRIEALGGEKAPPKREKRPNGDAAKERM